MFFSHIANANALSSIGTQNCFSPLGLVPSHVHRAADAVSAQSRAVNHAKWKDCDK